MACSGAYQLVCYGSESRFEFGSRRLTHWSRALLTTYWTFNLSPCNFRQSFLFSPHFITTFYLTGCWDADWGAWPISQLSLTGWIIQFGSSPTAWKTKKQDNVSLIDRSWVSCNEGYNKVAYLGERASLRVGYWASWTSDDLLWQ